MSGEIDPRSSSTLPSKEAVIEATIVQELHKNGAAHRDLKLDNIFLDDDCVPKVADYGLLKKYVDSEGKE